MFTASLAFLLIGGVIEWRLLRAAVPAYFRWGLLCYAAQVYPQDTSDPDEDDSPRQARRQQRLLHVLQQTWTRVDPEERWAPREVGPNAFALRPRFPDPLLVRARVELVDGGVHVQAFVPWSLIALPLAMVWGAPFVPGALLIAIGVGLLGSAIYALRQLDRLLYRGLEPLLAQR